MSHCAARVASALLLVVACLATLLNPATAQPARPPAPDTQIMDWQFAMPQGWRVANSRLTTITTGLLALEHTERASVALTQVTFGRPQDLRGTFRAWYNVHWANLNKDYAFTDKSEPDETESAGRKVISGGGVADMGNGTRRAVLLIGVNQGRRAGVLCFLTEDMDELPANGRRLEALLGSAVFASQRKPGQPEPRLVTRIDPLVTPSFLWDKPAALPKGEMPLEGLWGFPNFVVTTTGLYGITTRSSYNYFLFFKDGRVLRMMPPEGLLSFDLEFWKSAHADKLGTYTIAGEAVTVNYPNGEVDTRLTLKNGELFRENGKLLPRIKDERPELEGRYISIDHERKSWQFRKAITFWPQGVFEDEGFNSTLALRWWCGDAYWLLEAHAEPGRGKWRIAQNTLELLYTDGRKRRFGFNLHVKADGTRDMDGKHEKYLVLNSKYMTRLGDPAGPAPDVTPPPKPVQGAPDTQLDDWVFAMPPDWTITANGLGAPVLASRNAGATVHTWAQTIATAPTADFNAWFDTQWKALAKPYGVAQADPAQGAPNAAGYKLLARAGLGKFDGRNALVMLAALCRDGRAGALAFVSTDMDHVSLEVEAMDALLASASLASCRAKTEAVPLLDTRVDSLCTPSFLWPDAAPGKGSAGLDGIYAMAAQRVVSPDGKTEPALRYLTFLPDGRVIRQMPPEGLLNFRMEHWQRWYAGDCGTYQVNGDSVAISLPRGQAEPEVLWFILRDGALVDQGVVYRPVNPQTPRPLGRWLRQGWQTREKALQRGITFNADGTFQDEGFAATTSLGWWCGADFVLSEASAGAKTGQGNWRVEQNTLELLYSDGRKRRIGVHMHEIEGQKYMVLNGEFMVKA